METSALPSNQDIKAQLNRILAFPGFSNSPILSGFMKFIVEQTLAGESNSLKEYTIGVNVLSKKNGYDPQADGAVRIHAGRLRRALYDYYNGPGSKDSIYITVPKGTYIPRFELITPTNLEVERHIQFRPTLAVFPFSIAEDSTLHSLADGLCDQICTEFNNFTELAIVSYYSSKKLSYQVSDSREAGVLLDADYLLTGSIQSAGEIARIRVQLARTDTQLQVWSMTYEKDLKSLNTFVIQDDIVRHVVNQIAGSHGIVFRDSAQVKADKDILNLKVYDAIFWYYQMVNKQNEAVFQKALSSTREAVQLDPLYAQGWAILGEIYVAGTFNNFASDIDSPLLQAVRCGNEALRLDPRCHHAYQTLALAYLFLHQKQQCYKIVEQWLDLKSNAAAISGGLGFCLICAGDADKGHAMLMESIQINPYYPWWFNGGVSFYHFLRKEWQEAIYWADKMHVTSEPWELIMKIGSYVEMSNDEEAAKCSAQLKEHFPNLSENPAPYIGAFLQIPDLVERLTYAVKKSGSNTYKH
jgi:TolB-like protein/Tfp pilus assembly protein PilF